MHVFITRCSGIANWTGIRFVFMSRTDARRSEAFADRIGIETDCKHTDAQFDTTTGIVISYDVFLCFGRREWLHYVA